MSIYDPAHKHRLGLYNIYDYYIRVRSLSHQYHRNSILIGCTYSYVNCIVLCCSAKTCMHTKHNYVLISIRTEEWVTRLLGEVGKQTRSALGILSPRPQFLQAPVQIRLLRKWLAIYIRCCDPVQYKSVHSISCVVSDHKFQSNV